MPLYMLIVVAAALYGFVAFEIGHKVGIRAGIVRADRIAHGWKARTFNRPAPNTQSAMKGANGGVIHN